MLSFFLRFTLSAAALSLMPSLSNAQWVQTNGPYSGFIQSLAISGTNLFAGTYDGVFRSTDNGANWTAGVNTGLTNTYVRSFAVSDTNLFAGTYGGVFRSTDNGANWTAVNTGLTNTDVRSFAVSDTNLFAGTYGGGVWRRSLSEMITSVEHSRSIPAAFRLGKNYPNPFNLSTTITFSLPLAAVVSLKVFDALGEEVSTLVSGEMSAGTHALQWNAMRLPAGMYFYRLQAGSINEMKKITFLK